VVARLATDPQRGLTGAEAHARLATAGRNALPAAPPVAWWRTPSGGSKVITAGPTRR
jgi:hypothetical protein